MSTTMNRSDFNTAIARRGMLAGVCAALAAFIEVPCWIIRGVAVLVLMWHPIAAILVYLALAAFIRHGRGRFSQRLATLRDRVAPPRVPDRPTPGSAPMPVLPIDGLAARFANLDLRLARLEARAADPDRLLRRRFDRL
jgi:phage shock protein PspC (stress-responsive transcriptional regulator)